MHTYINLCYDKKTTHIYKIPTGSAIYENNDLCSYTPVHICPNTGYSSIQICYSLLKNVSIQDTWIRLVEYKPVYFERFKYVGKGFKLIFKKKKKIFNCIFGYSHIYWVRLQDIFVKKTRKYKFFFSTTNVTAFAHMLSILKKIKPINRYTLRGVRTYKHVWIKRKGRKSVATHV